MIAPGKTRILSTRPLEAVLLEQAAAGGILIDTLSFIATEPVTDEAARIRALSLQPLIAVFTSMNAVETVANCLRDQAYPHGDETQGPTDGKPLTLPWKVFCIGHATQQLVTKYFGESCIAGTASSAAALADNIIHQHDPTARPKGGPTARAFEEVYFFCGDQRRDELPAALREQAIRVNELIVYRTIRTPHKVEPVYDGIVFFSPSAVHSFFQVNKIAAGVLLFAIGQTTADTIRTYSSNPTILSGSPDKAALIRQVIDYFQDHQNTVSNNKP